MPDLSHRIVEHLSQPDYHPARAKPLAKQMRVRKDEWPEFRGALERLIESGRVLQAKNGMVRLKGAGGLIAGIIKRTSSGAGLFLPHDQLQGDALGKVYINSRDMRDAHTGDEVLVQLLNRRRGEGQRCGRIVEILDRATNQFVGTYQEREGDGYVQVDGSTISTLIYVGDPGAKGAIPGDKVVLEMLRFPSLHQQGEGVITKVLGPRGEPGVDLQSIIHEFTLPDEFPPEVLEDARLQAQTFHEENLAGRLDLTKEVIVTIDPADARDFDDAISLTREPNGNWRLGVHIADVSHFVRPGTALDREARLRGNSVYLPGKVLPMLPEIISNALASLQQGKVRFTKSAFIEFSPEGTPLNWEFANSAIKVTRRFAYEEVLPILREPQRYRTRVSAKVRQLLANMFELAMLLRGRRFERGALELTLAEVKLDLDPRGKVAGAHKVENDESHQIIEEFMLAANVAVATELNDRELPFLRRAHGSPDEEKLRKFAEFVQSLGFELRRFQSRRDLQRLLDEVKGDPAEQAINFAFLRSLKQAEYTAMEVGHYALAEEQYCHFTSPIRRYPDLLVHRLLDALLAGSKRRDRSGTGVPPVDEMELQKIGKHCSLTERRADQAERELIKVKLLTYLADHIGMELDATITGVESFGLFCQGVELPAEGMVHISNLPDDYYDYEATSHALIGRRGGQQYRLGDRVRVSVAMVDIDRRQLDFRLLTTPHSRRPPSQNGKGRQSGQKRTKENSDEWPVAKPRRRHKPSAPRSSGPKRKRRGNHS